MVTDFEVQYDEEREQSVHWPVKNGPSIKLGKEKVKSGMSYTVRVRKINESGPGPWSEPIVVPIPAGCPSQPSKPSIKLTSPTEGTLTVRRLLPEDEHGSPVTALIIETCIRPSRQWTSREIGIDSSLSCSIEAAVTVEQDSTQYFRVKLKNNAGISIPSSSVELIPSQLIPSHPRQFKVKARTESKIELQWGKPAINPQAAKKYELQKRTIYGSWETVSTTHQLSAVATRLEPDTKYMFRVRAINSINAESEFSDDLTS